jgi:hypothetical protein
LDEANVTRDPWEGLLPITQDPEVRGPAETAVVRRMKHGTNKSDRIIVMHSMTGDGMLSHPEFHGLIDEVQDDGRAVLRPLHPQCTAGCIWPSNIQAADYHKCLHADQFMLYVLERLDVCFTERYSRDAAMVLVLDSKST